jgi:hypothetical protein
MRETGDFVIVRVNNRPVLIFYSSNDKNKQWYLPGLDLLTNINRQIAIETEILGNSRPENDDRNNMIDSGEFVILSKSRFKTIFKLEGKNINQKFIMLTPSWGRWTQRPISLIIKLNEPGNNFLTGKQLCL